MKKLNYVLKNTFINMRRNPLLVIATMLAVLVSSFLVFTTLSARAIVENNTSRWQNGVHVVSKTVLISRREHDDRVLFGVQ